MKKMYYKNTKMLVFSSLVLLALTVSSLVNAQVKLLSEVEITDNALYFDGVRTETSTNTSLTGGYDFAYGQSINPHGDCLATYKQFVFLTWYRGGKGDRHVMLTRYNLETGAMKTIEFPHRHTGLKGKWWIGETHNTIAVGICPRNGTIHMVYDMHAYGNGGAFVNDYFRYSYSSRNVADIADEEFTLDKFVKDPIDGDYKHCTMSGVRNPGNFSRMTYPEFFLNSDGELFLKMRKGSSYDGAMVFIKYDDAASKWGLFKNVTALGAKAKGETHDWSIYGTMKFSDGKMRLGFQRRLRNGSDKYYAQNGVYYAYSNDPTGASQWKTPKGEPMTFPLVKAGEVLVVEPGDWVETTKKDMVSMIGGFDFEVTDNGDEHLVSTVKDRENNVTKKLHTYRKAGDSEFTTVLYDAGSNLYAAGNDIYVIGLKNGRANVVKTAGGTSDFKQVYQHNSGPTFQKGVVHIDQGKLYYYLLKNGGSGDKRTTYLQVFDLGIDTTRTLAFVNVSTDKEIELGGNLSIEAQVGSAFKEVSLWAGDTNLGTKTSAPYVWAGHELLTNMRAPAYTFTLKALDSGDVITESSITLYTPEDTTLKVSFINPANGDILAKGKVINVEAKMGSALTEVSLWLGDTNMGTLTGAPFKWELSDLAEKTYQLKLIASNGEGTIYSDSITITVSDYVLQGTPIGTPDALCRPNESVATLFDGDLKTGLNTQGDARNNAWAGIDFGEGVQKRIIALRLALRVPDNLDNAPLMKARLEGAKIYGANTVTWDKTGQTNDVTADTEGNLLHEITAEDLADANLKEIFKINVEANTDKAYRYVLIFFSDGSFGNCAEFGVYTQDVVNSINDANVVNNGFKIYPNPAKGLVFFDGASVHQAKVYTLSGQLMKEYDVTHNQVDISMLKSGMYLLQITDDKDSVSIGRFVVQ